ncbi:MAG TPA: TraB/GumN family protein [Chitinophagaceae bacterium]|nr:TraB/GumN family protein [Chitinophagaceae bacterium]
MKRFSALVILCITGLAGMAQNSKESNTLLWKISGNGLAKPSYLYGTIHMLCADDAVISPNFKKAINNADEVYLEVNLDNLMEIFGALGGMKMKGDTTLEDLLDPKDYARVKEYFEKSESMIPFSMLETFQPIMAASLLSEGTSPCDNTVMMEQEIMGVAKDGGVGINGLETMAYQAGVLDSIPYKLQAQQLLKYIDAAAKGEDDNKEMDELMDAYKKQDLDKLEKIMVASDAGMSGFTDILLYHRNQNWVIKLKKLLLKKSLVVAVGAGHLPGEKGLINLLRKEGYKVTPVENKLTKTKEI